MVTKLCWGHIWFLIITKNLYHQSRNILPTLPFKCFSCLSQSNCIIGSGSHVELQHHNLKFWLRSIISKIHAKCFYSSTACSFRKHINATTFYKDTVTIDGLKVMTRRAKNKLSTVRRYATKSPSDSNCFQKQTVQSCWKFHICSFFLLYTHFFIVTIMILHSCVEVDFCYCESSEN